MVHLVAAEARLSAISGVLPMAPTIPSLVCMSSLSAFKGIGT
jgi:hypothetical protein